MVVGLKSMGDTFYNRLKMDARVLQLKVNKDSFNNGYNWYMREKCNGNDLSGKGAVPQFIYFGDKGQKKI